MPQPTFNGTEVSVASVSVVCFNRSVAPKFGDEDIQFFFRGGAQIALRHIRTAVLKFSKFGEKLFHNLHHFRSRLGHA